MNLKNILSTATFSLSVLASSAAFASSGAAVELTPDHWSVASGQETTCGKDGAEKSCGGEKAEAKGGGEKSCGGDKGEAKPSDPEAKKGAEKGAEKGCGTGSCG
jgi:hypothetical protein